MRLLYDIFFILFSLFYLPVLIFKGKAHRDFGQRFGFLPDTLAYDGRETLWVHTVSVGEVLAAREFVPELARAYPDARIIVSVTTRTGHDSATLTFKDNIQVFYFPLDIHFITDRVVSFIKPKAVMILETEIWPNFILSLRSRGIPVILVNGRISDRSFKGYCRIRSFLKSILLKINLFLMQSKHDGERIVDLGAPAEKVKVAGTMKYDSLDMTADPDAVLLLRTNLGLDQDTMVLVAGSTHPGEENIVLNVFKRLSGDYPSLRLIIAPRHIDRAGAVQELCAKLGLGAVFFSKIGRVQSVAPDKPVIILDTIGDLRKIYRIAAVVFVGGSLIKKGGQNIAEPAVYSKPVIVGPYTNNFREMAYAFANKNAAVVVKDEEGFYEAAAMLLAEPGKRDSMGKAGHEIILENKGAVKRVMEEIKKVF